MRRNRHILFAFVALALLKLPETSGETEETTHDDERHHRCAFVYQVLLSFREIFHELKAANRRCNGSSFSTWIARLAGECDVDKMTERDNEMEDLSRKILALGAEADKCAGSV